MGVSGTSGASGARYRVYERSSAAEEESTAVIDGKYISVTFDDTNEIVYEEVGVSGTRCARVSSFRGDGARYRVYEGSSASEEESTAVIDGKEISVTFDDKNEIVDEEVGVSGTRGARAATFPGDGARHHVYEGSSAAEEGSIAVIDRKKISVTFDDMNEIVDEEV